MSEAKHTPAPWRWFLTPDGIDLRTPDRGQLVVMHVKHAGERMLRFAKRGPDDRGGIMFDADHFIPGARPLRIGPTDIDHPDARLIAAAPDLLAACEAAVIQLEYMLQRMESSGSFYPGCDSECKSRLDTLRSALAKARGGAA